MTPTRSLVLTALLIGSAAPLAAQSSGDAFGQLHHRLHTGDRVFVIDRQGRETTGTVKQLTATSIFISNGIDQRELLGTEIGRIEKEGDPVWNGALIGVAASAPYWVVGTAFV